MKQQESDTAVMYDAALYLRLSRDDIDKDGEDDAKKESDSIGNQRDLLRSFVKAQTNIRTFDIYVDDGYSGSNFDRPEFKRMTSDIESGKVNCVIVKDLSRFGRDYIEAGRLIQKIYPAFSVRFIAITDNYDSLRTDPTESNLMVPFKNLINDSYCRDISGKVRSQQKIKREQGDFIGAFAPYGYAKAVDNKNQLIIDEYAADVVRKVFTWKIDGYSLGAIAEKLNERYVLPPKEYKQSQGIKFHAGFVSKDTPKWSAVQIGRILDNEVYIGNLLQGKEEVVSYKVKKRLSKSKEEWVKVEGTHKAIIKASDFQIVQRLLRYDGRASKEKQTANIFSGFLFCGDCGAGMVRRVNKYKGQEKAFYICQTKNKTGKCSRHSIKEETLKTIVLKEIQVYTALFVDYSRIMEELKQMEVGYEQVVAYDSQIAALQKEYNRYYALKNGVYGDLKEGLIKKEEFDEFRELYSKKCSDIERAIAGQKQIVKEMFQNGVAATVQLNEWKESLSIDTLDRGILAATVERIEIFEDKRIQIVLRYENEIAKMQVLKDFMDSQKQERVVS